MDSKIVIEEIPCLVPYLVISALPSPNTSINKSPIFLQASITFLLA